MTKTELTTRIIEIIAAELDIEIERITPETRLVDDLRANSYETAEIIVEIEDQFGHDSGFYDCETVGELVEMVEKLL